MDYGCALLLIKWGTVCWVMAFKITIAESKSKSLYMGLVGWGGFDIFAVSNAKGVFH